MADQLESNKWLLSDNYLDAIAESHHDGDQ